MKQEPRNSRLNATKKKKSALKIKRIAANFNKDVRGEIMHWQFA